MRKVMFFRLLKIGEGVKIEHINADWGYKRLYECPLNRNDEHRVGSYPCGFVVYIVRNGWDNSWDAIEELSGMSALPTGPLPTKKDVLNCLRQNKYMILEQIIKKEKLQQIKDYKREIKNMRALTSDIYDNDELTLEDF